MLKKDTIAKLKSLGFDYSKLESAIKAEDEQDFAIPEINHITEDQLAERDKQVIAAAKPEIIQSAKKAGIEIANKAIAKKFNLTDADISDPDKIAAALEASVAKGDTGLKEQISLLQKDKQGFEAKLAELEKSHKSVLFDTELISHFPANRNGMSDKEFLALTKMNLSFEEADGVQVVKKDGQVLRNPQTQAPIPVKDAIGSLFNEKKWVSSGKEQKGRGGDDNQSGASGLKKLSQVREQWLKDNPDGNVLSDAFMAHTATVAGATTDFDYYN